jgi:gluconokinase
MPAHKGDHLLSIDIGTTHTKAMLYRLEQGILGVEMEGYPTEYPQPGYAEQDPGRVLQAVIRATQRIMEKSQVSADAVVAVVFSAALQSLLPVDQDGRPLAPLAIWSDTRSLPQNERLKARLDAEVVKQRTGCTLHPMYLLSRLAWFQEEAPEIFQRTARFITVKEYIVEQLFGARQVDYSVASGGGAWNMHRRDWDADLLAEIGLTPAIFSESIESASWISTTLKAEMAAQLGLRAGTPGIIGAFDGGLSHLGSVGLSREKMSLTMGTGAALRRRIPAPRVIPGSEAWCYYLADDAWLLGGVMHDAGNTLAWFAENLIATGREGEDIFAEANRLADEAPPGAEGLLFLPLLSGERCPHYRPDAKGVISGLTFVHGRGHFTRALMEGLAYQLYGIYRMLTTGEEPELVVTGGILKSPTLLKIVADLFGRPMWLPKVQEASAWGGILLALKTLGVTESLEESEKWIELSGRLEPDPGNTTRYQTTIRQLDELHRTIYQN